MRRSLITALLLETLSGCGAGWHREPLAPETAIPLRKQVRVYHGGKVARWHAAQIHPDSITGVEWLTPVECDSCRIGLPLAVVDSIQVGDPSAGFMRSLGLTYVAAGVFLFWMCQEGFCSD